MKALIAGRIGIAGDWSACDLVFALPRPAAPGWMGEGRAQHGILVAMERPWRLEGWQRGTEQGFPGLLPANARLRQVGEYVVTTQEIEPPNAEDPDEVPALRNNMGLILAFVFGFRISY